MLEHLTSEQIEQYRARRLKPEEFLQADRHLFSCAVCRAQLPPGELQSAFSKLKRNLQTASDRDSHLDYQLLEAFVDNRANELDREIVESHIEMCSDCAAELKELQAFAAMLKSSAEADKPTVVAPSLWQKFLAGIGLSTAGASFSVWRLAAVAAMLLLIAAVSTLVIFQLRNFKSQQMAQSDNHQATPENLNANQNKPANPVIATEGNQNQQTSNKNIAPPAPPRPTSVFAFLVPLEIGKGGGDESTLKIAPDVGFVDLKVAIKNAEGKTFTARLKKQGGGARNFKMIKTQDGFVALRIRANELSDGFYYLTIRRAPAEADDSPIETGFTVVKLKN
ncbi:MAG: zf-HC2 domain-containing protein [Acidobacteriota bacterium]